MHEHVRESTYNKADTLAFNSVNMHQERLAKYKTTAQDDIGLLRTIQAFVPPSLPPSIHIPSPSVALATYSLCDVSPTPLPHN
jgi:hypothetical protein